MTDLDKVNREISRLENRASDFKSRPGQDWILKQMIEQDRWLAGILREYIDLKYRYDVSLQTGEHTCGTCGQTYFSTSRKSRYCSTKCRVANHRKESKHSLADQPQK